MQAFLNFLNNNWVTSIITGLLVFFVTEMFKRIKQKKYYLQQVSLANKEIFNTIKLSIPEVNLPSPQILKSIHGSTVKQYNLKKNDVDSLPVILDDLIKEIMESNFLSHENKLRYCQRLLEIKTEINTAEIINTETVSSPVVNSIKTMMFDYNKSLFSATAVFAALIAMLITFVFTLIKDDNYKAILTIVTDTDAQAIFTMLALITAFSFLAGEITQSKLRKRKIEQKEKQFKDKDT